MAFWCMQPVTCRLRLANEPQSSPGAVIIASLRLPQVRDLVVGYVAKKWSKWDLVERMLVRSAFFPLFHFCFSCCLFIFHLFLIPFPFSLCQTSRHMRGPTLQIQLLRRCSRNCARQKAATMDSPVKSGPSIWLS